MELTLQWYWEDERDQPVARFLLPLTLNVTIEMMRASALEIAAHPKFPAPHSFTIRSSDGAISERWFCIDGKWRRKNA
jgi:hypothetical protein